MSTKLKMKNYINNLNILTTKWNSQNSNTISEDENNKKINT
jgi:hypothetical protein